MKKINSKGKDEYFIRYRLKGRVDGAIITADSGTKALNKLIKEEGEELELTEIHKI